MRAADAQACAEVGDVALMRAAGECIAQVAKQYAREPTAVAFAGAGNNGGDAFAAMACMDGFQRTIYAQEAKTPSDARADAERRALESGVRLMPFPQTKQEALQAMHGAGIVIAGLVGTGARLPLDPLHANVVEAANPSGVSVLAIDIPPGIDAELGRIVEPALRPTVTVTLGALKIGLLLAPARSYVGDLWLADIEMPAETIEGQHSGIQALNDAEFLALLPRREQASDKRSAGAPLIVAGSQQFPGAAILCAMGAARAGAGYVTVATPKAAAPALRTHLIEQVVVEIEPDGDADRTVSDLLELAKRSSSVGLGPGLGLDDRTGEIVREFCRRVDLPLVVDASGLFHFAKHLEILRDKKAVLTPHAGEFARLSGKGTVREEDRIARLREFVDRTGVTTLLKGQTTLVYDGTTLHVNTTGSSALATAGTGDVLTGLISTLLAQGLHPVDAARAGAYWHGLAGKHAQKDRARGVIARDVYESLAAALPAAAKPERLTRVF